MNKELKKLKKQIEKHYLKNNQHLIIDSCEVFENNDNDCAFDIHLADSDIFLFTAQNYNSFRDIEIVPFHSYFKLNKCIATWDGVQASCAPFYMNRTFTLKTFKAITRENILNCAKYFANEILDCFLFNFKFVEEKNEEKK